jgi:hypothetical protein
MKPKLALLVSVTLTTLVVVILTGVINQVKETAIPVKEAIQVAPTEVNTPTPTEATTPTPQTTPVSPEQAASLAAQILNRQDLFSVETITSSGVAIYKVTFSNGDLVYMSQDGQVLSVNIQTLPANVAAYTSGGNTGANSTGSHEHRQESSNSGSNEGGDHEDEGD